MCSVGKVAYFRGVVVVGGLKRDIANEIAEDLLKTCENNSFFGT